MEHIIILEIQGRDTVFGWTISLPYIITDKTLSKYEVNIKEKITVAVVMCLDGVLYTSRQDITQIIAQSSCEKEMNTEYIVIIDIKERKIKQSNNQR